MFGGERRKSIGDGHGFDAIIGRERICFRKLLEKVSPGLSGGTPGRGGFESGQGERKIGGRGGFVAHREAFRSTFGQVMRFIDDQGRIGIFPARNSFECRPVAGREHVVIVADDHVGMAEHRFGDIPRRDAGDAAEFANAT